MGKKILAFCRILSISVIALFLKKLHSQRFWWKMVWLWISRERIDSQGRHIISALLTKDIKIETDTILQNEALFPNSRHFIRIFGVVYEFNCVLVWSSLLSFSSCSFSCVQIILLYPKFRRYIRILGVISDFIKLCSTSKFPTLPSRIQPTPDLQFGR